MGWAQFMLSQRYSSGRHGVPQSYERAAQLMELAAKNGYRRNFNDAQNRGCNSDTRWHADSDICPGEEALCMDSTDTSTLQCFGCSIPSPGTPYTCDKVSTSLSNDPPLRFSKVNPF